jgi:predicted nucleic acid-binding Zn finger protein
MNVLLQECMEALPNCEVLSEELSHEMVRSFFDFMPENNSTFECISINEVDSILTKFESEYCYLIWGMEILVIKTKTAYVFTYFDDVEAVSFDAYAYSPFSKKALDLKSKEDFVLIIC